MAARARRRQPLILAIALACAAPLADAQVGSATASPEVRQALERGYWVVRPGDRLRAIARRFHPQDRERTTGLRNALLARNPQAFVRGDANALVVGAKLYLPPELTRAAAPAPSVAQPAPAATPRAPAAPIAPTTPSPAPSPPAGVPAAPLREPPPILARPAPAPSAPAYVDQLIDPSATGPDIAGGASREDEVQPFGRRSLAIDLRTEWHDNDSRRLWERGIGINYRRETAQWGDLGIEADLRSADERARGASDDTLGGKATLYQYRMPLGGAWLADNMAGVLRAIAPNMVSSGFRVNLPAPLLFGVASTAYSGDTRFYAQAGRGARLTGFSTQQVDLDDSRAAILGAEKQFSPWLRLGAQGNTFRVADTQPWRSSYVLAAEAFAPATKARVKVAGLQDDEGRKGFWVQGEAYQGFFHHHFGGYQFDRDVVYNSVPIANDERLLYLRSDYRTQRLSYSAAFDASQTNLDRDPARPGRDAFAAFGSMNLRISRTLSAGGSLNLRHEKPRNELAARKNVDAETAFVRVLSPVGTASFDLARSSERTVGEPDVRSLAFAWNHEWPAVAGVNITTTLSRANESGLFGDTRRTVIGTTLRSFPYTGVYVDLSLVRARVDRDSSREDNFNASLGATWQFLPEWQAQVTALWNNIETSIADVANPTFRDRSVQLTLRYQRSGGIPIVPLGARQPGMSGSGRIVGRIFFDDNDDGIRQANERPAARVTLFLDGRFPVTTDSDGRFEFPLVAAGPHTIRVGTETIPLPWGLIDEGGIPIAVPVRGDAVLEIPLKKIAP